MLSVQWQTASTSDYERDILSTTLAPMTLWHLLFAHASTCAGGPSDGAATLKDDCWAGCAGGALGPCSWSTLFHGALKTKEVSTSMSHISPTPIGKYHLSYLVPLRHWRLNGVSSLQAQSCFWMQQRVVDRRRLCSHARNHRRCNKLSSECYH
jgi:hypothetical protein